MYHDNSFVNSTLNEVLWDVANYLDDHPQELFVLNIQQVSNNRLTTETFTQNVNRYLNRYSSYIYRGGSTNPTVAEMRGRVVIITQDRTRFSLKLDDFVVENNSGYSQDSKTNAIKFNLNRARRGNINSKFMNYANYDEEN